MDQYKLVAIIKNHPQVWDRNNELFNKKEYKENAWRNIGCLMGTTAEACKDAFKGLREKYIREREKVVHKNTNCKPWDLLSDLSFLDPHIIERQKYASSNIRTQDSSFNSSSMDLTALSAVTGTPTVFDKQLINLVKDTESIWNRNCNMYTMNKQVKNELWQKIGKQVDKPPHFCMLRWKALREKYIRQKNKFHQVGEQKWELLEDMQFLDKVILYRRKASDLNVSQEQPLELSSDFKYYYSESEDNSLNDLSSDYVIKEENREVPDSCLERTKTNNDCRGLNLTIASTNVQKPDSSMNESPENYRKRTPSETSDYKESKRVHRDFEEKTPERLFGDLVVSMLMKKNEASRSIAMIEIMKILTK